MCGISGVYLYKKSALDYKSKVHQSIEKIAHRGPDAQATSEFARCVLGHTRLAIIDTSSAANQPLTDSTGRYTIVYNGEIFNYKELRQDLIQEGYHFLTNSDTEVVLNAFIHYGSDCVKMFNGFFAFTIYDQQDHILFGARDRFGIKPFLYQQNADGLFFCSELAGLVALGIEKELDYNSLFEYLQYNYIPSPKCIFKNVSKLNPGTFFYVNNGKMEFSEYYDVNRTKYRGTYDDAIEELRVLLTQSVTKRMVSDVPLGTFLSGGTDSSIISMLAQQQHHELKTFSIGYADEPFFDETNFANEVAKKIGSQHHVFKLSNSDLINALPDLLDSIDEPFADSSALPVNILSRLTREHVTVALSGDGADEIFAGYNKYMGEWMIHHSGFKGKLVSMLNPILKNLPKSRNSAFANKVRQLERFNAGKKMSKAGRYLLWCKIADEHSAISVLHPDVQPEVNMMEHTLLNNQLAKEISKTSDINEILRSDINLVLQSDMLHKVDKMSMSHSLEVRVPFLDHRVVDFAMSLPEEYKIIKGTKKRILQDAYRNDLPDSLYNRAKHGFEVPLLKWLRTELRPMIEDELLSEEFVMKQGVFNITEVNRLKKKLHSKNPEDSHARIWALLVFQSWWKKYMI